MNVSVAIPTIYALTDSGELWTHNSAVAYPFWKRYLDVFDEVHVLARMRRCAEPPEGWNLASGPGVVPAPLPTYRTPIQLAAHYRSAARVIHDTLREAPVLILRAPSLEAGLVWRVTQNEGRPYGVEVVGDPHDAFGPGASKLRLRPLYRWWMARRLRQQCLGAAAAAYVTESRLQRRYPAARDAYTTHYSSIKLNDDQVVETPKTFGAATRPMELVLVGTLHTLQKGPQILIESFARCVENGTDLRLSFVGHGQHQPELVDQAKRAGVSERIRFCGYLSSRQAVQDELDRADLFVLPSFQEGLPRAMIEAMGRALPCIGSTVGGIPELLPPEDTVEPGDVAGLAAKIEEVVKDPERMTRSSERNLTKAREYLDRVLQQRRDEFYEFLRDQTNLWNGKSCSSPSIA